MSSDMSINLNSEASCRRAYLNRYYQGNTMHISSDVMNQILKRWSAWIKTWQEAAHKDMTQYEIDDEEFKTDGWESAEARTGYDGNNSGAIASTHSRGLLMTLPTSAYGLPQFLKYGWKGLGYICNGYKKGISWCVEGGKKILKSVGNGFKKVDTWFETISSKSIGKGAGEVASEVTEEVTEEVASEVTEEATEEATKNSLDLGHIFCWASAAMCLANGLMSWTGNKNKEAVDAAVEMNAVMVEGDATLTQNQEEMGDITEGIQELEDQSVAQQQETQAKINEDTANTDALGRRYSALCDKRRRGQASAGDIAQMNTYHKELKTDAIAERQEGILAEGGAAQSDITSNLEAYQENYDTIGENSATVAGEIEFAASFDEESKTNCVVESVSQGMNAISGVGTAIKAGVYLAEDWWTIGLAIADAAAIAAATTGTIFSTLSMKREIGNAKTIGQEIDARAITTTTQETTQEQYEEDLEFYAGSFDIVNEASNIEVPDDITSPEPIPDDPITNETQNVTPQTTNAPQGRVTNGTQAQNAPQGGAPSGTQVPNAAPNGTPKVEPEMQTPAQTVTPQTTNDGNNVNGSSNGNEGDDNNNKKLKQ